MYWTIQLFDRSVRLLASGTKEASFQLKELDPVRGDIGDIARFKDWAVRYETAVKADRGERSNSYEKLLAMGREVSDWLDEQGWIEKLTDGAGPIELDIETADTKPDATARAFLDVPWELLATASHGFLALDPARPFCVQRRLGKRAARLTEAERRDLFLMFMAASPRNVKPVLDYEAEEAGILAATNPRDLTLTVEESGCLAFLSERLDKEGPFEALHLSCHGDIARSGDPFLLLESPEGELAKATAADLYAAFGQRQPALIVLSACRTAEHEGQAGSLAVSLLHSGVPAVLGWDGSVLDTDANAFAESFYYELARHHSPAYAAAVARQKLLQAHLADGRCTGAQ